MKVLYDYQIFNEQVFGGISRYISFLNKHIGRNGVDSKIGILLSNNEYLSAHEIGHSFFPKKWFPKKLFIMTFINKLYCLRLINSGEFNLLHASYFEDYYFGKSKIPVVVTVYDMIHERLYNDYKELQDEKFIEKKKKALINADLIIAISENTRQDVLDIYPFIDPIKIKTVHLCLMIEEKENEFFEKYENTRPYYLFVGSRIMYKNFDLLLNAFSLLTSPEFDVIFAGGGEFTAAELEKMEQKGVRNHFRQVHAGNDGVLNNLYKNALGYISTSTYEGFGLPVLESFNNNCAVLLSDNACYREIAADGADYFSLVNVHELTNLMEKIFKNLDYREKLKDRGAERLKFFSKDKLINETIKAYTTIQISS